MTLATIDRVTYRYPGSLEPALRQVSVNIDESEFALVSGPSGGGKSTLLRLFNGLVPQFHGGTISGAVTVNGMDAIRTPPRDLSLAAGMVFQEPEVQSVAETVIEEIAFGMEQRAIPRVEMHQRANRVLSELGIDHLRNRRQQTLSGGERQRVAISAVLAAEPELLLLDEPTSQLDEDGAESLISALVELSKRRDIAVLVSEHRLDRLMPRVGRVIEVDTGVLSSHLPGDALVRMKVVPTVAGLFRNLGLAPPLTLEAAQDRLPMRVTVTPRQANSPGDVLVEVTGVSVAYREHVALREATFDLREGEIVALMGANGSGKSSLFRALTGLTLPFEGRVAYGSPGSARLRTTREITGFAGLVPQDPAIALYRESVRDEISESLANRARGGPDKGTVDAALSDWRISEFAERNPRDISVGQQQRVAVAAMLAHRPPVWLLDEPTRGADERAKEELRARMTAHAIAGGAVLVATHDVESAARFATRVITLQAGEIISDLPARQAFSASGPHPTQVARLVPGAITADEVTLG